MGKGGESAIGERMSNIWKVEDLLEDAFYAVISAASISGLSLCRTYSETLPVLPYCAILALSSDRLIEDANYGTCENRKVVVSLKISAHSQDYTRAQYSALVSSVMDSVYVNDIISQLNAAVSGLTCQDINFGKISRGISEDHTFETIVEIMVDCYPTT